MLLRKIFFPAKRIQQSSEALQIFSTTAQFSFIEGSANMVQEAGKPENQEPPGGLSLWRWLRRREPQLCSYRRASASGSSSKQLSRI